MESNTGRWHPAILPADPAAIAARASEPASLPAPKPAWRLPALSRRATRSLQLALLAGGVLLVGLGFLLLPAAFRGQPGPVAATAPTIPATSPATRGAALATGAELRVFPALPAALPAPELESAVEQRRAVAPRADRAAPRATVVRAKSAPDRRSAGASVFDTPIAPPEP